MVPVVDVGPGGRWVRPARATSASVSCVPWRAARGWESGGGRAARCMPPL